MKNVIVRLTTDSCNPLTCLFLLHQSHKKSLINLGFISNVRPFNNFSKTGVLAVLVDSVGGEAPLSIVEGVGTDAGAWPFEVLLVALM